MISVSHFSRRLEITLSLSATLAPPRIATNGLTGLLTALPRNSISFCIRYPTTLVLTNLVTPSVEQCALWHAPKASLTYTSQRDASSLEKFSSFLVSSFLNLVFWRRTTSPSFIAATAAFALGPTTSSSAANTTSLPSFSESLFATGASDSPSLGPFLTFPRCEQRITLPPSLINFLIVGSAATILFSSVITPFLSGTLKSHLTSTL